MSNATQVYVNKEVVRKTCNKIIDHVVSTRKKLKERLIKELMEPYRYLIVFTKQRTRKQAEDELRIRALDYPYYSYWQLPLYTEESLLNLAQNLLKASIINEGDIMLLSLSCAVLIENWRDSDVVYNLIQKDGNPVVEDGNY